MRARVNAYHADNLKEWSVDFGGSFFCIAISKGYSNFVHTDATDHCKSYAIVVPFGDFTGGDFSLPSRGISVPVAPGQFLAVTASFLPHCVMETIGTRYALTFFTEENVATKARDVLIQLGLKVSDLNFTP